MRIVLIILILAASFWAGAQQYYLKGQVTNEQNIGIQNVLIKLQSSGTIFQTGTDGYFGIVSNKPVDSASFYFDGYDTAKSTLSTNSIAAVVLKANNIVISKSKHQLFSITNNLKPFSVDNWLTNESYSNTIENSFVTAVKYPSSEVSLNYNRASYSNVRRFLNQHELVPPDAVRIEEMLNYFNWSYQSPEDNNSFKIKSTLTACPWNKANQLLFLNLYAKKINRSNLPPSQLVFLIDVSGSMELPNRLPLLKSAFKVLVNNLRQKDTVSIVAYGGTTRIIINGVCGTEKEKLNNAIDSLQAYGNTPGGSGIKMAYKLARMHFIKGGNNRVILATDGDFNVGITSEDELEKLIVREKEAGLYLTCLGVGMGNYKDSKIQTLAQKGNGNFAYLDSYAEAEKVLFKEFFQTVYTVADEALLNIKFNPAYVQQYKLIGFDNKLMAARDTTAVVAGGEIGSGNSLVVAFEIKPTSNFVQNLTDPLAEIKLSYQQEAAAHNYLYTVPINVLSDADKEHKLASAVLLFGMKLKKSPAVKKIKWNFLINYLKQTIDTNNYTEAELLTLVQTAKKIYTKEKRFLPFGWSY